jgi:hypothetical protein
MNHESFRFKEIELEFAHVPEVLRCLLHTILFQRQLDAVKPKEEVCILFEDINYVSTTQQKGH